MNLRTKRGRRRFRGKAYAFYNSIYPTIYRSEYGYYIRFIRHRHYYFISDENIYRMDSNRIVGLYKALLFGKFLKTKELDTFTGRISVENPPLSNLPKAG